MPIDGKRACFANAGLSYAANTAGSPLVQQLLPCCPETSVLYVVA